MKNLRHYFTRKDIPIVLSVIVSALLYSFGMNRFVKSANLFPGGYSGIARLLSQVAVEYFHFNLSFSVVYFALNIVTAAVVWNKIGHKFIIYSGLFFTLCSVFTSLIPVGTLTDDILLISVFGGVISGVSTGIVLRNNASSGGTDFIAIWMSTVYNRPTWNYIMAGNAVILVLAGILFGWDKALYSIIYQFVSTQIVQTMHQRYKFSRLEVITKHPEHVAEKVFMTARHGITKVKCQGEYSHEDRWMLITTINTYQIHEVIQSIKQVDPRAFITISEVERIIGNYYQKPLD